MEHINLFCVYFPLSLYLAIIFPEVVLLYASVSRVGEMVKPLLGLRAKSLVIWHFENTSTILDSGTLRFTRLLEKTSSM